MFCFSFTTRSFGICLLITYCCDVTLTVLKTVLCTGLQVFDSMLFSLAVSFIAHCIALFVHDFMTRWSVFISLLRWRRQSLLGNNLLLDFFVSFGVSRLCYVRWLLCWLSNSVRRFLLDCFVIYFFKCFNICLSFMLRQIGNLRHILMTVFFFFIACCGICSSCCGAKWMLELKNILPVLFVVWVILR